MTKKYSRRIVAVYIDSLIIGFVVAILIELLRKKEWLGDFSSLSACILLVLFIFKDFVFRNAGIGKKMMGLVILNENDAPPTFKQMLKRGVLMSTLGYIKFQLCWLFSNDDFQDWELRYCGTKVVNVRDLKKDV